MRQAASIFDNDVSLEATELKLGLPGRDESESQQSPTAAKNNKRSSPEMVKSGESSREYGAPAPKGRVVGWPPVRAQRKNVIQQKRGDECEGGSGMYVKVSMDGAPYLRKIDLKCYSSYLDLVKGLENMFNCTIGKEGSEYAPTYEDKDGDWMLVGDVPWEMFTTACKRMRIMKGCEGNKGLACL